jgi:hypothetical protein
MTTKSFNMNRIQVMKCHCGATFAACREPDCYTDTIWKENLSEHVLNGGEVNLVKSFKFSDCTCKKNTEEPTNQLTIFDVIKEVEAETHCKYCGCVNGIHTSYCEYIPRK